MMEVLNVSRFASRSSDVRTQCLLHFSNQLS